LRVVHAQLSYELKDLSGRSEEPQLAETSAVRTAGHARSAPDVRRKSLLLETLDLFIMASVSAPEFMPFAYELSSIDAKGTLIHRNRLTTVVYERHAAASYLLFY